MFIYIYIYIMYLHMYISDIRIFWVWECIYESNPPTRKTASTNKNTWFSPSFPPSSGSLQSIVVPSPVHGYPFRALRGFGAWNERGIRVAGRKSRGSTWGLSGWSPHSLDLRGHDADGKSAVQIFSQSDESHGKKVKDHQKNKSKTSEVHGKQIVLCI